MPDPSEPSLTSPVQSIPTDTEAGPREGIALCLSGGGYRAMLFHLGALWRLNELRFLPRLNRISSVSGGSITAGLLGLEWSRLAFDANGVATAFETQVVGPIRALASSDSRAAWAMRVASMASCVRRSRSAAASRSAATRSDPIRTSSSSTSSLVSVAATFSRAAAACSSA